MPTEPIPAPATLAMPELVHWKSRTKNGGRTTIIGSTADAVALGRNNIHTVRQRLAEMKAQGIGKVTVTSVYRESGKKKTKTVTLNTYTNNWEEDFTKYEEAVQEITTGNPEIKHAISELAAKLMAMALDIRPNIASAYSGFQRWEEGDEVLPDLLREGDDRPFLRRKRGEQEPKSGKGDGAYRIIINTDVSWWGTPEMNAAVMGALVLVLQQFAPVEIWIQQGWMGAGSADGVSLFKLDFNGSFDPTQLSFWCGSPHKDIPFSYFVNRAIGRDNNTTSQHPELPCDLYMRGDWMTLHGISTAAFAAATPFEQLDLAANWIASTSNAILFVEEPELTA